MCSLPCSSLSLTWTCSQTTLPARPWSPSLAERPETIHFLPSLLSHSARISTCRTRTFSICSHLHTASRGPFDRREDDNFFSHTSGKGAFKHVVVTGRGTTLWACSSSDHVRRRDGCPSPGRVCFLKIKESGPLNTDTAG